MILLYCSNTINLGLHMCQERKRVTFISTWILFTDILSFCSVKCVRQRSCLRLPIAAAMFRSLHSCSPSCGLYRSVRVPVGLSDDWVAKRQGHYGLMYVPFPSMLRYNLIHLAQTSVWLGLTKNSAFHRSKLCWWLRVTLPMLCCCDCTNKFESQSNVEGPQIPAGKRSCWIKVILLFLILLIQSNISAFNVICNLTFTPPDECYCKG